MVRKINVARVPVDYNGPIDGQIDKVIRDENATSPKVMQETVSEDGETTLDRALISGETRTQVQDSFTDFKSASQEYDSANTPDEKIVALEKKNDALESIVAHMWDCLSGEEHGSLTPEQE